MFSLNVTVLSYITINRLYSMLLKHCKFALRYEFGCEMFSTLPMTSFNSYFYCCFFLLLLLFFFFTFSTSFYFFLPHLLEVIQIFVASMYSGGSTLDCCFSDLVHFFILEPMKFWWGSMILFFEDFLPSLEIRNLTVCAQTVSQNNSPLSPSS